MIGSLLVQCVLSALLPAIIARSITSALKLPRTQSNLERIHSAVVALYVAYSLGSAGYNVLSTPNYYRLLGISHDANPGQLRQRWIALARLYHPDKLGGSEEAQEHFRMLQKGNEILKTDTLRKAYERFGANFIDALPPSQTLSERDLVLRGATAQTGWYIVALVVFILLPRFMNKSEKGKTYWRISTLLLLLSNEFILLTGAQSVYTLPFIGTITIHEITGLLRQLWLTFNMLLTQLPIFNPAPSPSPEMQLANGILPYLQAMRVRSDISQQTLDKLVKAEVENSIKKDGGKNKEETIDRIVQELARL